MKPILEKIPLRKEQTIIAFRHNKPNFETPWHFHPQHELTYIEKSVGTKFIGDYVGAYEPGELVLLRSNLPHYWKNQEQVGEWSQSIVIQWNKGIFNKVPELQPVFNMLHIAAKGILFKTTEIKTYLPIIKRLPLLKGATLYLDLLSILIHLSNCTFQTLSQLSYLNDMPPEYSSRMKIVHEFIENNYSRKIYLKELADLVHLTEQSFSRFFKKMMGRSFFVFLNEYRINRATRMLLDTDWSVAEISYACGYESLPFFHKQFNKYQSQSPAKFRKKRRS